MKVQEPALPSPVGSLHGRLRQSVDDTFMLFGRCSTVPYYVHANGARIEIKMPVHKPHDSASPYPRERRYRRFDLQFLVDLSFCSAGAICELHTASRNVSIGGLLLKAPNQLPARTQVSLTIEVKGPRLRRPVRILGEGDVVRVEQLEPGAGFAIAIECKPNCRDRKSSSSHRLSWTFHEN